MINRSKLFLFAVTGASVGQQLRTQEASAGKSGFDSTLTSERHLQRHRSRVPGEAASAVMDLAQRSGRLQKKAGEQNTLHE